MAPLLVAIFVLCLETTNTFQFPEHFTALNDVDDVSSYRVSNQCLSDISIFKSSMQIFFKTLDECRKNGGCTEEQKLILIENMYAFKQLDSFGKIPPGIMELPMISSGSYRECKLLEAPYETHYCYARAILENQTDNPVAELGVKVAVCMPASCSEQVVTKFLSALAN